MKIELWEMPRVADYDAMIQAAIEFEKERLKPPQSVAGKITLWFQRSIRQIRLIWLNATYQIPHPKYKIVAACGYGRKIISIADAVKQYDAAERKRRMVR